MAQHLLRAEARRIARVAARVIRDEQIDPERAEAGVIELLASFPVYRSYLADGETNALQEAAATATRRASRTWPA